MIVVTAPTGNIGSQLLSHLIPTGEPLRVVARDPGKLPAEVTGRVEVIEGSHADPAVVRRAFAGADTVFWLVPGDPRAADAEAAYVEFARPACEALRNGDVRRVVGISALGRGWGKPAGHVTATLAMDDAIAETGVAYRALACSSLMENNARQAASIRDKGMIFGVAPPELKLPYVATRDVAAVAARLLLDKSWSGADSVALLGPEALSFDDIAGIMTDVLGKPVAYREISMEDLRASMKGRGTSDGMAQAMVDMLTAKNEGMDDMVEQEKPEDTPTAFRRWAQDVLKPIVDGGGRTA